MRNQWFFIMLFSLVAYIPTVWSYHGPSGGWNLESDREGIRIYTRPVDGSRLKQVRAVTTVRAHLGTIMHILTDFDNYEFWMNNLVESEVVDHPLDSVYVVYAHDDSPWPVQDRYHYDQMIVSLETSSGTVAFKSIPHYGPGGEDKIEKEWHEGWWRVQELEGGTCEIEFILNENPGGYVPQWLVNYLAVDAPYKTLVNLKARAESMGRP